MNQTNFSKNTQKACQAIITLFLVITLNSYILFMEIPYKLVIYHTMKASEFIGNRG